VSDPLSFAELRATNVRRCEQVFHPVAEWSPTDWACAMGGECGEALNLVKKLRRGEPIPVEEIGKELADLITYADLLAERLGIDLGAAVRAKFNEVSNRIGATVFLPPAPAPEDAKRDGERCICPLIPMFVPECPKHKGIYDDEDSPPASADEKGENHA
jgi:NTP pyrophosphatase (non-canonical NTP hydrolase)